MSDNNHSEIVYYVGTIDNALSATGVIGVKKLSSVIKAKASEWEDCLVIISEKCAI
jgi:hypothetical protein